MMDLLWIQVLQQLSLKVNLGHLLFLIEKVIATANVQIPWVLIFNLASSPSRSIGKHSNFHRFLLVWHYFVATKRDKSADRRKFRSSSLFRLCHQSTSKFWSQLPLTQLKPTRRQSGASPRRLLQQEAQISFLILPKSMTQVVINHLVLDIRKSKSGSLN